MKFLYKYGLILKMVLMIPIISNAQQLVIQEKKQPNKKEMETFNMITKVNDIDITPYITAISNANFDPFRLVDARRTIRFENGIEAELLSAQELSAKFPERMSKIILTNKNVVNTPQPLFRLTNEGALIAIHPIMMIKEKSSIKQNTQDNNKLNDK